MLLKVGELAKRTGVTVRTLHHYDSIGLLRPSGRSGAGYRLYDRNDVARLHGIQALRHMGVPLAEVAELLDGGPATLPWILARQVQVLDQTIARSQVLRDRLGVMQLVFARGDQPEIGDWIDALSMMTTLERHFSVPELTQILQRWKQCASEWPPLVQAIRSAMERDVAPDSLEIQPLLQRWLDLGTRWMEGDLDLLMRWGTMLRDEPGVPLPAGMDRRLLDFIDEAVRHRLDASARHIGPEHLGRLMKTRHEWRALVLRGQQFLAEGVSPRAQAARALAQEWEALLERTFGSDAALRDRVFAAYENEPSLHAGIPFTSALRQYMEQASGP